MFAQTLSVTLNCEGQPPRPVPLAWLDSFAMRNFTNDAAFDDTLPIADGLLEAGFRVPLPALIPALEAWYGRKGWLPLGCSVQVSPICREAQANPPDAHPTLRPTPTDSGGNAMQLRSLRRLLVDELQEVYISQELALDELKRQVAGAAAPALQKVFQQHTEQTRAQLQRLETAFEILGDSPRGGHGKSMHAMLGESEDRMGDGGDPPVVDAALVATARRVEHWEIAAYSTALILAQRLGLDKVPALLAQTLGEVEAMDARLADLAREMPVMGSEDKAPTGPR